MHVERRREMKRMEEERETERRATGLNVPQETCFFFYSLDRKRSLTKSQRTSFPVYPVHFFLWWRLSEQFLIE
jgi:hypothetical protein